MKKLTMILMLSTLFFTLQSCQRNEPLESSEEKMSNILSETTSEETTEAFEQHISRNPVCVTYYDTNGTELSRNEYSYDEHGNTLSELFYYSGKLQQSIYYTYDQNQNLIRMINTDLHTEQSFIFEYEYDNSGNKISETSSETHGYFNKRTYEYDDLHRVAKITNSSNNSTITFTYSDDNVCTMLEQYEFNGTVIFNQTEEKYNENGLLIYQAFYKQNSLDDIEYKTTHTYNTCGLLISSETFMGDELFMSVINEYRNDLLIRTTNSDAEGVYQIVEYEYDQYDNLVKKNNKLPSGLVMGYSIYEYAESAQ